MAVVAVKRKGEFIDEHLGLVLGLSTMASAAAAARERWEVGGMEDRNKVWYAVLLCIYIYIR